MEIKVMQVILMVLQWLVLGIQLGISIMEDQMKALNVMTPELTTKYSHWKLICCGIISIIFVILVLAF